MRKVYKAEYFAWMSAIARVRRNSDVKFDRLNGLSLLGNKGNNEKKEGLHVCLWVTPKS